MSLINADWGAFFHWNCANWVSAVCQGKRKWNDHMGWFLPEPGLEMVSIPYPLAKLSVTWLQSSCRGRWKQRNSVFLYIQNFQDYKVFNNMCF
jgi:transposase